MQNNKPIHVKPSLYAFYFERLKEIALRYGYNLVLHGSMNRDLDLIAIPWQESVGDLKEMIDEFANTIGGYIMLQDGKLYETTHHGRMWWIINVARGGSKNGVYHDAQYYLDISVMPTLNNCPVKT